MTKCLDYFSLNNLTTRAKALNFSSCCACRFCSLRSTLFALMNGFSCLRCLGCFRNFCSLWGLSCLGSLGSLRTINCAVNTYISANICVTRDIGISANICVTRDIGISANINVSANVYISQNIEVTYNEVLKIGNCCCSFTTIDTIAAPASQYDSNENYYHQNQYYKHMAYLQAFTYLIGFSSIIPECKYPICIDNSDNTSDNDNDRG